MPPLLPRPAGYGPQWSRLLADTGWWHSFELPDGTILRGVCDLDGLKQRISQFPIPEDLRGKRVLDIGAWDGWFSFEMERRGAQVLAIDCWDNPRFREVHAALGSKVEYRVLDVYDVSPQTVGRFDIVLFMGVLYHLKHPLLALEKVCSVTTDLAAVESYVLADDLDPNSRPIMELYEHDEFEGQTDNWVAPNVACLLTMCRIAGFARVELTKVMEYGAGVACFRRWTPQVVSGEVVSEEVLSEAVTPNLTGVIHNSNLGVNFDSKREEYVACYFEFPEENLALTQSLTALDLQPDVGGLGVRPIALRHLQDRTWQVNFRLPLGLAPGWHAVRIRVKNGPPSNPRRIAVDMPMADATPVVRTLCDGFTWTDDELDTSHGDVLSAWVSGLPENADVHNVRASVNEQSGDVIFVGDLDAKGARQVNVRISRNVAPGRSTLSIHAGRQRSDPFPFELR